MANLYLSVFCQNITVKYAKKDYVKNTNYTGRPVTARPNYCGEFNLIKVTLDQRLSRDGLSICDSVPIRSF